MNETYELFPTPVALYEYDGSIDDELNYLKSIAYLVRQSNNHQSPSIRLRSGDDFLLKRKEMKNITKFVNKSLKDYATNILGIDESLQVTQSWANKSKRGNGQGKHNHPNSLISGVFYFQTNESAHIEFMKSATEQLIMYPTRINSMNATGYSLNTKSKQCILFPSSLNHAVAVNNSDEEHISLSFNTFYLGDFGSKENLTHLNVKELTKENKRNEPK